jgi:hypothetical protein
MKNDEYDVTVLYPKEEKKGSSHEWTIVKGIPPPHASLVGYRIS